MSHAAISTARLRLRPWDVADLRAFHAIWSDPEVVWWAPSPDVEASRQLLEAIDAENRASPPGLVWYAIVERQTDAIVGNVMVRPAPYATGEIDVGWTLARSKWGQGLATEAAHAAISRAFELANPARILAVIVPDNARSIRVAERLGFTRVGTAHHAGLDHDLYAAPPDSLLAWSR
jgi:RimJ/RimL family protein N-acetyltransferase